MKIFLKWFLIILGVYLIVGWIITLLKSDDKKGDPVIIKKIPIQRNYYLLNSKTECDVIESTDYRVTISTSEILDTADFQKVTDSLFVDNKKMVYFHHKFYTGIGEEYGTLYDGIKIKHADYDEEKIKIIHEKAKKEKELKGFPDEEFASHAFIISKSFVRRKLISPNSADFPLLDYQASNRIGNKISIRSYVDAKNAYNAEIRHNYAITLELKGGDWSEISNWTVLDFTFN